MSLIAKIKKGIENPYVIVNGLLDKYASSIKNDEFFIKWRFYANQHRLPNLKNPITYNEKCNWLKLNYRNPLFTTLADKIEVKKYVEEKLGPGHTFPLIKVYDSPEEIDFDELPNQFVLKCNHNSGGGMIICRDKSKGILRHGKSTDKTNLSYDEVRKGLKEALQQDYFSTQREWPYKNIKRRILAEKFMTMDDGSTLQDYKFFCFNGEPKYIWVGSNYDPMWFNVFSTDWKNQHVKWGYEAGPEELPRPKQLEEMLDVARKLSKGIPHVRVDLYSIGGTIYLGEFTFFTWAGFGSFEPKEWDKIFGDLLMLPNETIK